MELTAILVTSLVAQVPALLEALTGVKLEELLKHVPETGAEYRQHGERVTPARKPEKKEPPTPVVEAEPVHANGENNQAADHNVKS